MSLQAGQGRRRLEARVSASRRPGTAGRRSGAGSSSPPGLSRWGCGVLTTALGLGGLGADRSVHLVRPGRSGVPASAHPGQAGAGRVGIRQPGSGGRRRHAGHVGHAVQIPVPLGLTAHARPGGASQRKVPAPVRLVIPAIGVNHQADAAGDHQQRHTAGFRSARRSPGGSPAARVPGAVGAAIIAGHIDSYSGAGGIFPAEGLAPRPGHRRDPCERIGGQVQDHRGTPPTPRTVFRRPKVYGPVPDPELRLITCGGQFDYATGSYFSKRHRLRGPGSASQQAVRHATAMTPMTTDDLTGQVFGAFAPAPG